MTVAELIEALQRIPGDHDLRAVAIRTDDDEDEKTDMSIERVTVEYGVALLEHVSPLKSGEYEPWKS